MGVKEKPMLAKAGRGSSWKGWTTDGAFPRGRGFAAGMAQGAVLSIRRWRPRCSGFRRSDRVN